MARALDRDEWTEAFERFKQAVSEIVKVPKDSIPKNRPIKKKRPYKK